MKNFETFLFRDNLELYEQFRIHLEKFIRCPDFTLLKNEALILTRENYTAEYLRLNLVKDKIPSLSFQTSPIRKKLLFFSKETSEDVLSDLACKILFKKILDKKKTNFSEKIQYKIATELFQQREDSICSLTKIPENNPYYDVFVEFEKMKNKKTYSELLKAKFLDGQFSISDEIAETFPQKTIFCFGLLELDLLTVRILEKISEFLKIQFFLTSLHKTFFENNDQLDAENLSSKHILKHFPPAKLDIFAEDLKLPKMEFFRAMEIRREVEFVARNILKKIDLHRSDENFRLFQIKMIVPRSEFYSVTVKNIFDSLKIPVSFSSDSSVKLLPYYSLVTSLMEFLKTDFESVVFRDIVFNPCFSPSFDGYPFEVLPDLWSEFVSIGSIVKYRDSLHRKEAGIHLDDFQTWDRGWRILARKSIGISEEGFGFSDEEKEQAVRFIEVSSSLIGDLIYLTKSCKSLLSFANFFKQILESYTSSESAAFSDDEQFSRMNKKAKSLIFDALDDIAKSDFEGVFEVSVDLFFEIFEEKIRNSRVGSSGVYKNGVVVGTLKDTSDISFRYIYMLGADESSYSTIVSRNLIGNEDTYSIQKDLSFFDKIHFYKIFQQNPTEINFSYVSMNTVADSPVYPHPDLDLLRSQMQKNEWRDIPLFSENEILGKDCFSNLYEESILQFAKLKKIENKTEKIKFANPSFYDKTPDWLLDESADFSETTIGKEVVENYFCRKRNTALGSDRSDRDLLSATDLAKYIECPYKFFFEKELRLEEELDYPEESFEIDPISRIEILRSIAVNTIISKTSKFENIFHASFFQGKLEKGIFKSGILESLQIEKFKDYWEVLSQTDLFSDDSSFARIQTLGKFLQIDKNHYSIHFPGFLEKKLTKAVDLFSYNSDHSIFVSLEFSKSALKGVSDKSKIASLIFSSSIRRSDEALDDIEKISGNKNVLSAIVIVPLGENHKMLKERSNQEIEEFVSPFLEKFTSKYFPASPLNTKNPPCDFCKAKEVCMERRVGFTEFLKNEKEELSQFLEGAFQ